MIPDEEEFARFMLERQFEAQHRVAGWKSNPNQGVPYNINEDKKLLATMSATIASGVSLRPQNQIGYKIKDIALDSITIAEEILKQIEEKK